MKKFKISRLKELQNLLTERGQPQMHTDIIDQAANGDPDWGLDIITELDTIKSDSPFYLPNFHGVLKDYKSTDFDLETIGQELYALDPASPLYKPA